MALRNWVSRRGRKQATSADTVLTPAQPATLDTNDSGGHASGAPLAVVGVEQPFPHTLGLWLRERRGERGLALEQVEEDTRIGHRYLEAIEGDRFEVLPAPVYARGFVRLYARYLGLDPDEAAQRIPSDLPRPLGLEPIAGLRRREGAPALPAIERRWLLLVVVGVAVLAAVLLLDVPALGGDHEEATSAGDAAGADGHASVPPVVDAALEAVSTVPPFDSGRTPDFRGVEHATAEELLQKLSLSFVVIEVESGEAPVGRVFAQSPQPGAAIEAGDDVTLIVSGGPPAAAGSDE